MQTGQARAQVEEAPGNMATASPARIMVVDDEPSVLLTYQLLLEQKGYAVTALLTAREAISMLEQEKFDLLLCDLSLEEQSSGFEVIEFGQRRQPGLGCVLLTGYATVEASERAEKMGIAMLFKPIDMEQFFSLLTTLLGESHGKAKARGE
jgi:DNA-binding NtrC family response regulator